MCEANRWTSEDQDALDRLIDARSPAIAVLNKIDKVHPREEVLVAIAEMAERYAFEDVVPMSATRGENIDRLMGLIPQYLPESELLFPEDTITDRSESFRAAELIREKLTRYLRQEVPYGLTVQIEQFERDEHGVAIHAVIWVERDSQKGIVVGKGGAVLKRVGRAARLELKAEMRMPVHLEMWVKVKDNWADSEKDLLSLGYDTP
jgi:GTP-binding protein Era